MREIELISKPTKKQIKAWSRFGFVGFRNAVMPMLGLVPFKDDCPPDYQQAFKWACGRAEWPWGNRTFGGKR